MRLRARQSIIEFALLSRPGATSGATNRQGLLLYFHDPIMQYHLLTRLVNYDQSALETEHSFLCGACIASVVRRRFTTSIASIGRCRFHENAHLMNA
jgi:hypothetical protein